MPSLTRHLVQIFILSDANPKTDTTEQFNLLNRAYEVLPDPVLKQRYHKYGRRGVGTSAASDATTTENVRADYYGTGKSYFQTQQVARSDSGDVTWKGSRGDSPFHRVIVDSSKSARTLHASRRKAVEKAHIMTQPAAERDYYAVLSVHKLANDEDIRRAYKRLSQLYYDGKFRLMLQNVLVKRSP
jgi:curved DNA-binding protein CbpA